MLSTMTKFSLTCSLLVSIGLLSGQFAVANDVFDPDLPATDRQLLSEWIGYSPPAFPDSLQWFGHIGDHEPDWWDFIDRFVVLQSFTHVDEASVDRLKEVGDALTKYSFLDIQLIAFHTPQGAARVDEQKAALILDSLPDHAVLAVDHDGSYSDTLGIYTAPANMLVSREGTTINVGIAPGGFGDPLLRLLNLPSDANLTAAASPDRRASTGANFPPTTGSIRGGKDMRGKPAPEITVQQWVNYEPDCHDKVTLLEFWRTNCPHCINAIPKLNTMAKQYEDDLCIIAITHEDENQMRQGLTRRNVDVNTIQFAIANDPSRRMQQGAEVTAVPHAMAISSDGIVRWQGHPAQFSGDMLQQIVDAQNASPHARAIHDELRRSDSLLAKARARSGGASGGFPAISGDIRGAQDLRGKKAPALNVDQYIGGEPDCEDKVTLLEFWRTSCPHCITAIPKLNTMTKQYEDDMCIIGITFESESALTQGLARRNVDLGTIEYTIGLDTERRMFQAAGIQGVPHAFAVCSEGIVRWQGHPGGLNDRTIEQIINANKALAAPSKDELPRDRWGKKLSSARN